MHQGSSGARLHAGGLAARFTLAFALGVAALPLPSAIVSASGAKCTAAQGQALIESGQYTKAIQAFECVIDADPQGVEGYRGRTEAEVLLGRYSDAVHDEQRLMAYVVPVHPDAEATIADGYAARLASAPDDARALTGLTFTRWWFYHYTQAIQVAERLLDVRPTDPFATLFRGSSRALHGGAAAKAAADLDRAIQLDPANPHVRFIVADAYTYGLHDPQRAFDEASLALDWGLDTPRIHAILATSYAAFGDLDAAAQQIDISISLVTDDLVPTAPLVAGGSMSLGLVPGRVYAIPVPVTAGETLSIATSSLDMWDTIAVLLAPDGTPVIGSDDANAYFAAFDWTAPQTATYTLKVTSFEAVSTGTLVVDR